MKPNAYDAARTYARYLRDFGMLDKGAVLRLEPHKDGIAVVCEPGPFPQDVQSLIGERGTLWWNPDNGGLFLDADNEGWNAPEGWRSMPFPTFAEGIRAEAWDNVTLVFMPDDSRRASMFDEV